MKQRIIIKNGLILGVIFLLSITSYNTEPGRADWVQINSKHYEPSIFPGNHYAIQLTSTSYQQYISIEFVVPSGDKIDFFVFDQENYDEYRSINPFSTEIYWFTVITSWRNAASGTSSFYMEQAQGPYPTVYYAVFDNAFSSSSVRVKIDIKWFKWETPAVLKVQTQVTGKPIVGESIVLKVTVTNTADSTARNVTISLDIPSGLSATQTIENIGDLAGNDSQVALFSIECEQQGSYTVPVLINAINALWQTPTVSLSVLTPTDLSMTVSLSTNSIEEDQTAKLTVIVTNEGESAAEDVVVSINLPSGLRATTTSTKSFTVSELKETSFTIRGVSPGTYTITVTVNAENAEQESSTVKLIVKKAPTSTINEFPIEPVSIVLIILPIIGWIRRRR